ncbi:predicted protein [Postia placenta Mad-698-R]|nr:predicted protein [Postia placenta Mad-698-R]
MSVDGLSFICTKLGRPSHIDFGHLDRVVNLDKRETHSNEALGKLRAFFFSDFSNLIQALVVPFPKPSPYCRMQKPGPFIRTEALGYMNLPAELLYIIYSHIYNLCDAISLTITNERLASVGHSRVYELLCALHSSWAGDRIVCLGDYMTDDDLPPGMISQDELKSLYAAANPKDDDLSIYDVAINNFAPVSLEGQRWSHHLHYNPSTNSCLRDYSRHRDYLFRMSPNYASSTPEEDKWSLCNLTKHEYVRADIIAMKLGVGMRGPFIEGRLFRLEQIFFSLICWSSDESTSMRYQADLHRGAWAGDRIAINTLNWLSPPLDSGVWKDITIPVFKRLVDIYDWDCTDEEYIFGSIGDQEQSEDEERLEGRHENTRGSDDSESEY